MTTPDITPAMQAEAEATRAAYRATPDPLRAALEPHPDDDFVARAQRYRDEHEATHEDEMCGGPCIVLGLTGDTARPADEAHAFGFREGYRLAESRAADTAPLDGPEGCDEARRLLGYLWTATGYRTEALAVRDLFAEDDPIVADVERLAIFPDRLTENRP